MAIVRKLVIAQIKVAGVHYWDQAPDVVSFLRSPHRHIFTIRGEWEVDGADREVEFFIAQQWLRAVVAYKWPLQTGSLVTFGPMSCEMIAVQVAELLEVAPKNGFAIAPRAPSAVEVYEDDENGARVEFKRT